MKTAVLEQMGRRTSIQDIPTPSVGAARTAADLLARLATCCRDERLGNALVNAIAVTLLAGCVSAHGPSSAPDAHFDGTSADVVTTVELRQLDQGLSVMEALEHIRPLFLRSRGSVSTASIDGTAPTELSVLQMIRVAEVAEIRLVRGPGRSGPAAIRSDGTVSIADVILVSTRKRRD